MDLNDLPALLREMSGAFAAKVPLAECDLGDRASLRWPKILPVMRFSVQQYAAPGYGNVFCMSTAAMGGMMKLATAVFTPNCGGDVPLLLIDVMVMKKKLAAFVEYYDCTAAGAPAAALRRTAEKYASVAEYAEKPAWYVGERTPYSMIKGGSNGAALAEMLADSADAYAEECAAHREQTGANIAGISKFADRMVREGNPSSATLEKVLGKEEAENFFRTLVMPAAYRQAE